MSVHFEEWVNMGIPAGGGEVRTINVPYCPNCQKVPSGTGFIVE